MELVKEVKVLNCCGYASGLSSCDLLDVRYTMASSAVCGQLSR